MKADIWKPTANAFILKGVLEVNQFSTWVSKKIDSGKMYDYDTPPTHDSLLHRKNYQ